MSYQRKSRLTALPVRPFAVVESVFDRIMQPDLCALITTKANRDFLARLEREYQVERGEITKAVKGAFDYRTLATEIRAATGGPEHAAHGKKIVKAYAKAIRALEPLLDDKALDVSTHTRPGRTLTTREAIGEDIAALRARQRECADLLGAEARPALTTVWRRQAAAAHGYLAGQVARRDRDHDISNAKIYGLLSELMQAIYAHPAFDAARTLSATAIKGMVDNATQHPSA